MKNSYPPTETLNETPGACFNHAEVHVARVQSSRLHAVHVYVVFSFSSRLHIAKMNLVKDDFKLVLIFQLQIHVVLIIQLQIYINKKYFPFQDWHHLHAQIEGDVYFVSV